MMLGIYIKILSLILQIVCLKNKQLKNYCRNKKGRRGKMAGKKKLASSSPASRLGNSIKNVAHNRE